MECEYCHTTSRHFLCSACVTQKLQDFQAEITPIIDEKDNLIEHAEEYLRIKNTTKIHLLLSERSRRERAVATSTQQTRMLERECGAVRHKVLQLRNQVERRRNALQNFKNNLKAQHAHRELEHQKELAVVMRKWARTHKMMIGTRRVLINELLSLFDFRTRQQNDDTLVLCNVTIPTHLVNVSKIDKTELNTAVGHLIHITTLIARYLGIKLPFLLVNNGMYSHAKTTRWKGGKQKHRQVKMPLFLSDYNLRKYIVGMAMLNYDIAYLCHTQEVEIPTSQVTNGLQNLMLCCKANNLGDRSHNTIFHPVKDQSFSLDFNQVLRLTALRYTQHGTSIIAPEAGTGLRNEKRFYKISNRPDSDDENGRYRIGIAENYRVRGGSDENDDHAAPGTAGDDQANENWNIVDVLPTFNESDGEEDEEDLLKDTETGMMTFNVSASSIMPGVLGMMETLGNRSSDMSGIAYTFGLPNFASRNNKGT